MTAPSAPHLIRKDCKIDAFSDPSACTVIQAVRKYLQYFSTGHMPAARFPTSIDDFMHRIMMRLSEGVFLGRRLE